MPYEGGRWKNPALTKNQDEILAGLAGFTPFPLTYRPNPFDLNKKTETHKIGFLFLAGLAGFGPALNQQHTN